MVFSGVIYIGHPFLLRSVGGYLVVEDPLERAPAIVILDGEIPYRAMEAAELYGNNWASRIILTRGKRGDEYLVLRTLGIDIHEGWDYNRQILLRLGVPGDAIILLDGEVENTVQEITSILGFLRARGYGTAILVTSKTHSRRTAAIWRHISHGQTKAIIRGAKRDPFAVDQWWEKRGETFMVLREYLGLANLWLGLPMG